MTRERLAAIAFLLLRVIAGVLFAMHGSQRLFGWPAGERATGVVRVTASSIELVSGALIAAGVAVPLAAVVAGLTMLAGAVTRRTELITLYASLWFWIAARASRKDV